MTLYSVEVERTQRVYVYVDAENEGDAEEAALELAEFYGEEAEYDAWVRQINGVPSNSEVWVGGPEGGWVDAEAYNA